MIWNLAIAIPALHKITPLSRVFLYQPCTDFYTIWDFLKWKHKSFSSSDTSCIGRQIIQFGTLFRFSQTKRAAQNDSFLMKQFCHLFKSFIATPAMFWSAIFFAPIFFFAYMFTNQARCFFLFHCIYIDITHALSPFADIQWHRRNLLLHNPNRNWKILPLLDTLA